MTKARSIASWNYQNNTNYPNKKPAFLFDFAKAKSLPHGTIFGRASTATYYDGKTTAVAEENMIINSSNLSSANTQDFTVYGAADVPNDGLAPDGTMTATLITSSGGTGYFNWSPNAPLNQVYTKSVYMKAGSTNYAWMENYDGTNKIAYIDLVNQTLHNVASGVTAKLFALPNGWVRVSITYQPSISNNFNFGPAGSTSSRTTSGSIFVWGPQVEQKADISQYTPTTGEAIEVYQPKMMTAGWGDPRFHHNPATGESRGFLVEDQKSNYMTASQMSGYNFSPNMTVHGHSAIAPDGSHNANLIIANTASAYQVVDMYFNSPSLTNNITFSMFVKPAGISKVGIRLSKNGVATYAEAQFDLSGDGSVISTGSLTENANIENYGNGWYRVSVTGVVYESSGNIARLYLVSDSGAQVFAGNGFEGVLNWGWQYEIGEHPTSFIPTSGSVITRERDDATCDVIGLDYNNITVFAAGEAMEEGYAPGNGSSLFDFGSDSGARFQVRFDGPYISNLNYNRYSTYYGAGSYGVRLHGQTNKVALRRTNNRITLTANGNAGTPSSPDTMKSLSWIKFGFYGDGTEVLNNCLSKVAIYDYALSDEEMIKITEI